MKKYYIKNKELYSLVKDYHIELLNCKKNEVEDPPIPEKIQLAIYMIAQKSIKHKKFYKHVSHHDDMVTDATIAVFGKVKKFDPFWKHPTNPKFKPNPFAYFTECIFNEFKKSIGREHRNIRIANRAINRKITEIDLVSENNGVEANYLKTTRSFNEKLFK